MILFFIWEIKFSHKFKICLDYINLKNIKIYYLIYFSNFLLLFVIIKKDLLFQMISRAICEHDFNKMVLVP